MAVLDTETYLDAVCRMIEEGREYVPVPVKGVSMRPFLRNADFAYLTALPKTIKKGDILLFQRPDFLALFLKHDNQVTVTLHHALNNCRRKLLDFRNNASGTEVPM